MTRLETLSHELAKAFVTEGRELKLQVLFLACSRAAQDNNLASAEIIGALDAVRSGDYDAALGNRLEQLSQLLDDKYFDLSEQAEEGPIPPEALSHFQSARATSALAFALSGEPGASDALYEAISASASPDALIAELLQMHDQSYRP